MSTRTVVVVSFWPGNNTANGVGGFNWFPDDEDAKKHVRQEVEWHIGNVWTAKDHHSFAVQRFNVPAHLSDDEITEWLADLDHREAVFETNRQALNEEDELS